MTKKIILVWLVASISIFGFTFDDALAVGEFRYYGQVLNTGANWWTNLLKDYEVSFNEFDLNYTVCSFKSGEISAGVKQAVELDRLFMYPMLVAVDDDLDAQIKLNLLGMMTGFKIASVNSLTFSNGVDALTIKYGYKNYFINVDGFTASMSIPIFNSDIEGLWKLMKNNTGKLRIRMASYGGSSFFIYEMTKTEQEALFDLLELQMKLFAIKNNR